MVSVTVFPQSKMHPAGSLRVPPCPAAPCASCPWACGPSSPGPHAAVQVTPLHPQVLGGAHWVVFFCLRILACKDQTRTLYVGSVES